MIVLGCTSAFWDVLDCIAEALGKAVNAVFGTFFDLFLEAIKKVVVMAVEAVMRAIAFLWIRIDTPDLTSSGTIWWVQHQTKYIMAAVATIAVLVGCIQMAISQRGEPLRATLKAMITMAMVSAGCVAFAAALIQAADKFSFWIIERALDAKIANSENNAFSTKVTEAMTNPLKDGGVGLALAIFVGILMIVTALIQLALMVVRYGMLILLVGVLPLTAAATNTEMGMMWFKRAAAWLAGFIMYKPIAALIYATAIRLIATPAAPEGTTPPEGTPQTLKVVMGVTMMILAAVSLPAILRFVSPKGA